MPKKQPQIEEIQILKPIKKSFSKSRHSNQLMTAKQKLRVNKFVEEYHRKKNPKIGTTNTH